MRARLLVVLIAGCASPRPAEVRVERIEPSTGRSSEQVRVHIEGAFHLPLRTDLDDGRNAVGRLEVTIDDVPATDVVWRTERLIEATVPAGFPPGPHDVSVTLGDGSAMLAGGYVVIREPARLAFVTRPVSVPACTCSGLLELEVRDTLDAPVTVLAPTVVALAADVSGIVFYPDTSCAVPVTKLTIAPGEGSVGFAFAAEALGDPTVTASAQGLGATTQREAVLASQTIWYRDVDGDGFGDSAATSTACARPAGYVLVGGDCDDDPAACGAGCFPGNPAADVCDGRDQDCSPATADGDGDPQLGAACDGADTDVCQEGTLGCSTGALACSDVTGSTVEGPSASASCSDTLDNDCDGLTDNTDPGCATCVISVCGGAGGTCMGNTCVILGGPGAVTCPPGMDCRVLCDGVGACDRGVSCGAATSCNVRCVGLDACRIGGVDCGTASTCDVRCEGTKACEHGAGSPSVDCRDSACTVTCTGDLACKDGIGTGMGGTCTAHCCNGACSAGTGTCSADNLCM